MSIYTFVIHMYIPEGEAVGLCLAVSAVTKLHSLSPIHGGRGHRVHGGGRSIEVSNP